MKPPGIFLGFLLLMCGAVAAALVGGGLAGQACLAFFMSFAGVVAGVRIRHRKGG